MAWQPVRLFQARGDVPPHVDEDAAEVEDHSADPVGRRVGAVHRGLHDAVR